jgi:hypothetical protein
MTLHAVEGDVITKTRAGNLVSAPTGMWGCVNGAPHGAEMTQLATTGDGDTTDA